MSSEITLFVNPAAGRGRGAQAAQPAASALWAAGFSVRTAAVRTPGTPSRARAAVADGTGNDLALALGLPVRDPGADLTYGLFDVTVVGDCGRATLLRVFPKVYRGTHVDHPKVTVLRAAKVEIAAEGITGYADGEPLGPLPPTARCIRAALRVVGP